MKSILENIRLKTPLIHCITNYVTANDCANILLACGARPVMADEPDEVSEITASADALCINTGTVNDFTVQAMFEAGKTANRLGIPAVLDPAGTGSSGYRRKKVSEMIEKIRFAAIRGNASEIMTLAGIETKGRGVDSSVSVPPVYELAGIAKVLSGRTGAVICITGETDIISDELTSFCVHNGDALMSRVTGTGCQLSALISAFVSVNRDKILNAAVAAVCAMGLCGEKAKKRMTSPDGNASYGNYIIDAVFNLTPQQLESGAKYEIL